MYLGELIEFGPAAEVFSNPKHKLTRDYLDGSFG
jgi:phosphate transport system ATP-binding protein